MRTLIKLVAAGILGYLLYDAVTLVTAARTQRVEGNKKRVRSTRQPMRRNPENITGFSGEGMSVPVADPGGDTHTTRVGRGVL
jgi:hypothetical protein